MNKAVFLAVLLAMPVAVYAEKQDCKVTGDKNVCGNYVKGDLTIIEIKPEKDIVNKNLNQDEKTTKENERSFDYLQILILTFFILLAFIIYNLLKSFYRNQYLSKQNDKKSINYILNSINTIVIDDAIKYGRDDLLFYVPIRHYYLGVQGLYNSSAFHIYNYKLRIIFDNFYIAFTKFDSHPDYFHITGNNHILRFVKPREVKNSDEYEKYKNEFLEDVENFEFYYHQLIDHIKNNYPDIDISETNKKALEDYKKISLKFK